MGRTLGIDPRFERRELIIAALQSLRTFTWRAEPAEARAQLAWALENPTPAPIAGNAGGSPKRADTGRAGTSPLPLGPKATYNPEHPRLSSIRPA